MQYKKHYPAFTLIEILLGITIVSLVLTVALSSLSSLGVGKVKLVEKVFLEKQVFAFQEKIFESIKESGGIDYEEYFNRSTYSPNNYSSGHYSEVSGFWNFWSAGSIGTTTYGANLYNCRSPNGTSMGTGGCLQASFNTGAVNQITRPQRYGSYAKQFIDYNSDADANGGNPWDENGDGDIRNDDDDDYLGIWPQAFTGWVFQRELYLINTSWDQRTLFRRNVIQDPDAPSGVNCDFSNQNNPTGEGCLGTIEFLKLLGKDYGEDHTLIPVDANGTQYDGKVDTWFIDPSFLSNATQVIAWSNANSYRQPLFTDAINVKDLQFYLYPNKDQKLSWKDNDPNLLVAPYVRIQMQLSPGWSIKRKIKWQIPSIPLSTTIHLNDLLSN